jgi:hypothetical protein
MDIPKGDYGYTITFTCKDAKKELVDLTGRTIKFQIWEPGESETILKEITCSIVGLGTCTCVVPENSFNTVKVLNGKLVTTRSGLRRSTLPFTINVLENVIAT